MQGDVPIAKEAERAVLSAIVNYNNAIIDVREIIDDANMFYYPAHQNIYQAVCDLFDDGHPVDMVSVADMLNRRCELDRVGGRSFLAELTSYLVTSANAPYHAEIVYDSHKRRRAIEVCKGLVEMSQSQDSIDNAISDAVLDLMAVQKRNAVDVESVLDTIPSVINRADQILKSEDGMIGLPTGFTDVDRALGGLANGELITIAGRPAMGKTAFAMSIAENVAQKGYSALFYSLEMSKEQLAMRILCSRAGVDMSKLRAGLIKDADIRALVEATGRMDKMQYLYMDDNVDLTVSNLYSRLTRQITRRNVRLAIIDYLQIMTPPKAQNRVGELSVMTRMLKQTARRLNIPIILISQLSRDVERRTPPIPRLADLRESGTIEQDSDIVMFAYRPTYYGYEDIRYMPDPQKPGDTKAIDLNETLAQIIIGKHRHGATSTIDLNFFAKKIQFTNRSPIIN